MIKKNKAAAPLIKLQLEVVKVASPEQLDQALSEVKKSHPDAMFVFNNPKWVEEARTHLISGLRKAGFPE